MNNKDKENLQKILLEMPQWASTVDNNNFEKYLEMGLDELYSESAPFTTFENFDIRIANDNFGNKILFFVRDGVFVSGYVFQKLPNRLKTVRSWNNPNVRGAFYHIFVNFLIPNFKTIESDSKLTDMGYKFWEKLVDNNPSLSFYVNHAGELTKINTSKDLKPFYGKPIIFREYSYIVTTK